MLEYRSVAFLPKSLKEKARQRLMSYLRISLRCTSINCFSAFALVRILLHTTFPYSYTWPASIFHSVISVLVRLPCQKLASLSSPNLTSRILYLPLFDRRNIQHWSFEQPPILVPTAPRYFEPSDLIDKNISRSTPCYARHPTTQSSFGKITSI